MDLAPNQPARTVPVSPPSVAPPAAGPAASAELPVFRSAATRDALMAIYDAALRRWPIPYQAHSVPTRYGKTHVISCGDPGSPPLVLLHPACVGGFVWESIIASLSRRRRVHAIDTIGDVGKSVLDEPTRHPRKGPEYSAWLDDVWTALGLRTVDLAAGSMGGWIAMHHAIRAPASVRKLVLLGPMGLPSWRATLGVLGPMLWYVIHPTEPGLDRLITRSLGGGERVNREFRPWMRLTGKCKPRIGQPFHLSDAELRRVQAPTLVFLGGKDGLVGSAESAAERARRNLPRCEVEILPGAGHVMNVDEPQAVAARMLRFLDPD